jgi:hypothetical protein
LNRSLRDRRDDIRALGLVLVSVKNGGRHLRFVVRAPDGRTTTLIASSTPSDRNAGRRFKADARHFLEGK